MDNTIDSTGKVALVTGGNTGIGRAVALMSAKAGAEVAITYLNNSSSQTVTEIQEMGSKSVAVKMDVTDSNRVNGGAWFK